MNETQIVNFFLVGADTDMYQLNIEEITAINGGVIAKFEGKKLLDYDSVDFSDFQSDYLPWSDFTKWKPSRFGSQFSVIEVRFIDSGDVILNQILSLIPNHSKWIYRIEKSGNYFGMYIKECYFDKSFIQFSALGDKSSGFSSKALGYDKLKSRISAFLENDLEPTYSEYE